VGLTGLLTVALIVDDSGADGFADSLADSGWQWADGGWHAARGRGLSPQKPV